MRPRQPTALTSTNDDSDDEIRPTKRPKSQVFINVIKRPKRSVTVTVTVTGNLLLVFIYGSTGVNDFL